MVGLRLIGSRSMMLSMGEAFNRLSAWLSIELLSSFVSIAEKPSSPFAAPPFSSVSIAVNRKKIWLIIHWIEMDAHLALPCPPWFRRPILNESRKNNADWQQSI